MKKSYKIQFTQMIKRVIVILLVSLMMLTKSSCSKSNPQLEGHIKFASLNHVVNSREGCSFTELHYNVVITNHTSQVKNLINLSYFDSYCNRSMHCSNLQIKLKNGLTYNLALEKENKDIHIAANDSVLLRLRLMNKLAGLSLKDIKNTNDQFFNKEVMIIITIQDCRLSLLPSSDFKINYFLDENFVESDDSASWIMNKLGPPQP